MAEGGGCRDERRGSSASEVGTNDGTTTKKEKKKETRPDLEPVVEAIPGAWCLTSTETIRLIRDGEKGGGGYGGEGRGRLYTCRYTVTTRMTPALRWAAMRAILVFH